MFISTRIFPLCSFRCVFFFRTSDIPRDPTLGTFGASSFAASLSWGVVSFFGKGRDVLSDLDTRSQECIRMMFRVCISYVIPNQTVKIVQRRYHIQWRISQPTQIFSRGNGIFYDDWFRVWIGGFVLDVVQVEAYRIKLAGEIDIPCLYRSFAGNLDSASNRAQKGGGVRDVAYCAYAGAEGIIYFQALQGFDGVLLEMLSALNFIG